MNVGRQVRSRGQALIGFVAGLLLAGIVVPIASGTGRDVAVSTTASVGADAGAAPGAAGAPSAAEGDVPATATTGDRSTSGAPASSVPTASAPGTGAATAAAGPATSPSLPPVRGVDRNAGVLRIGVILYDISGASELGVNIPNVSAEDQRQMYEAYIADLNGRGGIGGLNVEAVYATVDALEGAESERAACISLTEDNEVYAVLNVGTLRSPAALCLTEEHGQLALLPGMSGIQDSVFARSGDLLFTIQAKGTRSVTAAAEAFDAAGYFDGKTVGITGDEGSDPGGEVVDALQSRLKELGVKVAYRTTFSADTDAAASQIPVEVSQHRSKGVDLIVLTHANGYQFVRAAEANGYTPAYAATDWNSYFSDSVTEQMPASFDGTPIYTHSTTSSKNTDDIPEYEVQKACRETYEKHSGRAINRKGTGTEGSGYILLLYVCGGMQMLERGAAGALPSLTYDAYARAMEAVGSVWIAGTGPGSFAPGKHDHADAMIKATWRYSCRCWKPNEAFG